MSGALAQDDGRYGSGPQYSTPGEMQQTDQLNQQARSGTTQSPAALNGEDQAQYSNPAQGSGNDGGYQAAPSPQQAQYDQQQQQYQQQMQQYGDQQQNYRSEHQRYAQDIRDYDVAQYAWSYPQAYEYRYGEDSGLKPLYLIAEPSQQLWQAPVEGPGGRWVGRVRNVEIAPDGRPNRVEIALNRRVSVWVRPGDLRFDPSDHILYTDLTRDALWEMPGATIESSPL
jgi:type II secretory pathway pseudopilin PulG